MTTILTGLRANSTMHLGNYLGAMWPMVNLQNQHVGQGDFQLNMFVPDLHSFITPIDHSTFQESIIDNARVYLAAGIHADNDKVNIYRQSRISAHSELTWILGCFTYMGELSRMTQYKDKTGSAEDSSIGWGLFSYPVLMAADILLYDAEYVPVGEDQRQHLELTRDLAIRFNNKFGDVFTVPKTWAEQMSFSGSGAGSRIKSLKNPDKKMSKSIDDPSGTILLSDSPSEAVKKVMGATTDSFGEIQFDLAERPGISNLLTILSLLSKRPLDEVITQYQGQTSYGTLKTDVAESVEAFLVDFRSKYDAISPDDVVKVLEQGEARVAPVANATLERAKHAVGLI